MSRITVTDEEIALINPDNLQLIDEYITFSTQLSPATKNVYRSNLNIFFNWVREKLDNKYYRDINMIDIRRFQIDMQKRGTMGNNRINHIKSALSSLNSFIIEMYGFEEEWAMFRNFAGDAQSLPAEEKEDPIVLEEEEVQMILDKLVEKEMYQHACCVALFVSSGMRISEVVQSRVDWFKGDDVNILDNTYYVTPKIRTKGKGEQGKQINKYVIKVLFDKYLDLWLDERERKGINSEDLFVRKDGDGNWIPVLVSTVRSWVNTIERICDIPDIHPHAFRRYTATWLSRKGEDIQVIRIILGHEDTKTTEIYISVPDTEVLKGSLDFLSD